MTVNRYAKIFFLAIMSVIGLSSTTQIVYATEEAPVNAFAEPFMIRIGGYFVDNSNTQFSIGSSNGLGLGSTIDYKRDLGGDERDTIPRIDAYYRFNDKHRIDFTSFSFSRSGKVALTGDVDIGDTTYLVNEVLNSEIEYTLYKVGYNYSFYRTPKIEVSFSAGLNIAKYDFKFEDEGGSKSETAGVTAPLPVFGLRMNYLISPKWSTQYLVELFAIKIGDEFSGTMLNFELNTEYRLFKNFALGVGLASFGLNADVADDKLRGSITDGYAGFIAFGTLYF